ncbi:hypothetical protein [Bradyrhizobium sp. AZCC 2289]|uniref:hypothetical protein n=1 Tax=Bradyrhizobium sp. AZCC 2289 TaxID=3117026 RepID=UPI002FF1B2F9
MTEADAPFPSGTSEDKWRLTRGRHADDVNAEVRDAVDQNGYSLFRIGLSLSGDSKVMEEPHPPSYVVLAIKRFRGGNDGKRNFALVIGRADSSDHSALVVLRPLISI